MLRIYQVAGLIKIFGVHSEIEASHAAAALRWVCGEKAAVVISIRPGALQALTASLVPTSDGIVVWYLFGDETSEDDSFNMQQIPKAEQGLFPHLAATLGRAYVLHIPTALPTALQRGAAIVDHPYRPEAFYLLMPMNTQPTWFPDFNLVELPVSHNSTLGTAEGDYFRAINWIKDGRRIVIKVGDGGRAVGTQLNELLKRSGDVLVHTTIASGCIPYGHPQNMTVGGSKGSLCGSYAMEHADLLIAVGTRAVCQSDCFRTDYPNVKRVININADWDDATHYNHSQALIGDANLSLEKLYQDIVLPTADKSAWLRRCAEKKNAWQEYKLIR